MKNPILFFTFFALFVASNVCYAQTTITGEIRPRFEYRHGFKSLMTTAQKGTAFIEQRTRLYLNYKSEKYKVVITFQDIRVWGSQPQLNKTDGLSSFYEAWGEYYFTKKFSAQIGRQELNYDDERIFGSVDWAQQGRSHDLVLFKFSDSNFTVHAGVAYNQNGETTFGTPYEVPNNYKEMQFLWLNKKISYFNISLLAVNNGFQSPVSVNSTRFSQTVGPYIEFKKSKIFVSVRGYYQTGTDGATKKDIKAFFGGADISYALISKLTIGIGGEILSGQSQTDTTKYYRDVNHSFNPLYGTAHKFNGYMDYFYVGNHINSVGLGDFYFKAKYKDKKWWIGLDIHQFITAADVLDKTELVKSGNRKAMDPSLGTELDLTFFLSLSKGVTLQAGYSHMLATETMKALKGGSTDRINNWAYVMVSFKPQLFKY